MDKRLSVSKLCPFLGDTSGTSGSKWRNISIEILKIKINVRTPLVILKWLKRTFSKFLIENKMPIGQANLKPLSKSQVNNVGIKITDSVLALSLRDRKT